MKWLRCGVYMRMMRSGLGKTSIRPPAVAGHFYPDDPAELRAVVSGYLRQRGAISSEQPKALIVPHAGFIYSGAVAAAAYATVASLRTQIRRIVLIGPSHRVYLRGIAVPRVEAFATPLGLVSIDNELKSMLLGQDQVIESDAPHAMEHCLEVQLPFLQTLFDNFSLLPLVIGSATPTQVAAVLDVVWGGDETLVLASSDLSHYHDYETARRVDAATSAAILQRATPLTGEQACGAVALNGLLCSARQRDMQVAEVARCNSGDTAGDKERVVGYGAFALHELRSGAAS